jgi:DNA-binding MarR family transcriptional regulator/N-acetylglutamate synthase-like GNAT family acetyltransferase
MMAEKDLYQHVEAVRRFNRFYTKQIGVLHERLLRSPFPLTEARVIYELAHHEKTTATDLRKELGLDAGYLSRLLRSFQKRGLIRKQSSQTDGRQNFLSLTERGQEAFSMLNARSRNEVAATLSDFSAADQNRLVKAMQTIEGLLGAQPEHRVPYLLRPHQPGDMGWVAHRHGVLYAEEYGWDEQFEALVASIVAKFVQHYKPRQERCWMAEMEGEIVGSVFLVKKSGTVAQLRLLLVEPKARGLGMGTRLVNECIRFARQVGYRKIVLWTNSVLLAARHIYEKTGFRLVHEEPHHSFGHDLIGQTWELKL